jgi:hypothetical protein
MNNPIYIVGRIIDDTDKKNIRWNLRGVFDDVEKAEQACETIDDFVRPVPRNQKLPEVGKRPTQIYFPLIED